MKHDTRKGLESFPPAQSGRRYDETHRAVTEGRELPVHEVLWLVLEGLDHLIAWHRQVAELVSWLLRLGCSAGVTVLATVGEGQGIPD